MKLVEAKRKCIRIRTGNEKIWRLYIFHFPGIFVLCCDIKFPLEPAPTQRVVPIIIITNIGFQKNQATSRQCLEIKSSCHIILLYASCSKCSNICYRKVSKISDKKLIRKRNSRHIGKRNNDLGQLSQDSNQIMCQISSFQLVAHIALVVHGGLSDGMQSYLKIIIFL